MGVAHGQRWRHGAVAHRHGLGHRSFEHSSAQKSRTETELAARTLNDRVRQPPILLMPTEQLRIHGLALSVLDSFAISSRLVAIEGLRARLAIPRSRTP